MRVVCLVVHEYRVTGRLIQPTEPRQYCTHGGNILSCHGMLAKAGVRTGCTHLAAYCYAKHTGIRNLVLNKHACIKTLESSLYSKWVDKD